MRYSLLTHVLRRWPGLLLALTLAGCGVAEDEVPREPIWGTVTLDGTPLKAGSISFASEAPVQGKAVATTAGAVIVDGRYSIDRAQGLMPGKYRVAILSQGGGPPTDEAPGPATSTPPPKDPIPAKYNAQLTTLNVGVIKDGSSLPLQIEEPIGRPPATAPLS